MWKKRDGLTTIEEVIQRNSGRTLEELLHPKNDSEIVNLTDAAKAICDAIRAKKQITIVGDYDADGICGAAILYKTMTAFGVTPIVRLPRRFSEGYGFSFSMLNEISDGLLITVDNGISAVEAITEAKQKGLQVVVLDHHLPRDDGALPPADVIVDPHVFHSGGFEGFCGAGIAYRLACLLHPKKEELLRELNTLAAIATVADVVPLIDDNRSIVMEGLKGIQDQKAPIGLRVLLERLNLFAVDESDISFSIGPILNAPGRMLDDGAEKSLHLLIDRDCLDSKAKELEVINNRRKELQTNGLETAEKIIEEDCMYGDAVLVLCACERNGMPPIPEGLAGILAGKLSEKYKVPAIVLTESGKPGIMKGSGRSYGAINLKELLDNVSDLMIAYGGHPKAVGLTIPESDISILRDFLNDHVSCKNEEEEEISYYDLCVKTEELETVIATVLKYSPFGEGNARPILRIENQYLVPRGSYHYSYMGKGNEHIKLFCGRNTAAVGFHMGERFIDLGEPIRLTMTGTIFVNKYMDRMGRRTKECQIRLEDIEKASGTKNMSPLLASVYANLEELGGKRASNF